MTVRNMDLIRDLLFKVEKIDFGTSGRSYLRDIAQNFSSDDDSPGDVLYHLNLLKSAGYFMFIEDGTAINGMSMAGHDFLDSVRNPVVWERTRDGANAAGSWTIDLLRDLAKSGAKKLLEEATGLSF
jgi:hypothetical protein